jgi:hypothetical protein
MLRLLKRLFSGPEPPPVEPDGEVIRFDDAGFTRSSHLIRSMGWRQSWSWKEITAFGFAFSPAMFPDPWFGDYMESQWFFTVTSENGPEHIYFDVTWLDLDHLPPALLDQMQGLDLHELRQGLNSAAVGFHNYEGEGRWIGWQRSKPQKRARRSKSSVPPKTLKHKRSAR